ncbi:MAG: fumarylacetoacetate hydrolase family protein [Anaerolineales bacterium]|nr:fumarylacetoacetate hydrolase family protein [Anaerolineales bacterium]
MKILRYQTEADGPIVWGWQTGRRVGPILGSPFEQFRREEATIPLEDIVLLAPVQPGKIICVGRNYAAHAAELNNDIPDVPMLFLKPPGTVIGPGESIQLPPQSTQVEHEAELALVIGTKGRWIKPEDVDEYIFGYTAANDVTARDLQSRDGQWTRSKGFDTFCPLGPWIETEFNPADAMITCSVNGQMRQMGSTRDMVFTIRKLVAFISSIMTLDPGDVILSGTPAGVGPLHDGDEVAIEIEGLGVLTNPVRSDSRE